MKPGNEAHKRMHRVKRRAKPRTYTQFYKHSHWDVAPGKETNKRMQPNEIG
jgi:hypothetical protein